MSRAAKIAWQPDRPLVNVTWSKGSTGAFPRRRRGTPSRELNLEASHPVRRAQARLDEIERFQRPLSLKDLTDESPPSTTGCSRPAVTARWSTCRTTRTWVGCWPSSTPRTPPSRPSVTRRPLAARRRRSGWVASGCSRGTAVTSYTDDEENQNAIGKGSNARYLADALENAGATYDDAPFAWPHTWWSTGISSPARARTPPRRPTTPS